MAENKEKKGLKSLDMADLVNYEKATRLLCIKYENSFKGYDGFPGTICASVNEEVVHGIPGNRVLEEGDIISIELMPISP